MKRINDVKISTKLFLGFLSVLVLTAVVGVVALVKLSAVNHNASELADNWLVAVRATSDLNGRLADIRRLEFGYALRADSAEDRAKYERDLADDFDQAKKDMADYEPTLTYPEEKKLYAEFKEIYPKFLARHGSFLDLTKQHKTDEARQVLFGDLRDLYRQADERTEKLVTLNAGWANDEAKAAHATYASARVWIIAGLIVATVLGLLMAWWISRLIAHPLQDAAQRIVKAQAEHDLSLQLEVSGDDEVGQLCAGFNAFTNDVHEMVVHLAQSAEQIASASEEISASATQMANGSETQKDQVHQVATAMQEMSATVHEVSENSSKAADSARQTSETARRGGAIVEDTLAHMRSIAGSVRETAQKVQELGNRSDQIGKIVGVIDDIADQTNLLALNAAIEAARAGEQGRGFAVVADEVRKLAERTTKATKEIAEMIQSVQAETRGAVEKMQSGTQQVEKGVEVTAKAGESLKQIIGQAEHVGEMVTHIATAATEQSSATEQVNNNMDQINRLVAESADGAQQSAKACEQLSGLALELQNMVSRFKVRQQTTGGYRSPRQATPDPARVRTALALAPRPPVQHALHQGGHDRNGD